MLLKDWVSYLSLFFQPYICIMWEVFARLEKRWPTVPTHFLTNFRCMPQTTSVSVQEYPSILPLWIWQKKEQLKPDRNCLLSWMIQKSSMFRWGLFLDTDYYVLTGMVEAEAGVRAERGEYAPQILAAQLTLSQPEGAYSSHQLGQIRGHTLITLARFWLFLTN